MIQRVMPDLMGLKGVVVLNDEAHHCYRARPKDEDTEWGDRTTARGEDTALAEAERWQPAGQARESEGVAT